MKRIFRIFTAVLLGALWFSCSPDESSLGDIDVTPSDLVEGIAYKIEHDADNPNIVYLTSLMDARYTPQWEHPQGRSQDRAVTLKMPFDGTYEVKFGVQTRGGVVYGEPVTFTIDEFYADFVNHELWTLLTGGVGNSKTWIHDDGSYGLTTGEMDYADPTTTVEWNNFAPNYSPGKGVTGDANIWSSTMTFSLDGGANVIIDDNSEGGEDEAGTFMLDVDNHTITLTNANILHTQSWDFKTTNWAKNLKILTLTENQLQVAVYRELVSGESEWWMIWNYVSKEYADNYVPEDLPDPVPPIDGDPNDVLTTTKSKTWILSPDSPYDWADLNGGLLNKFSGGEPAYLATNWAAYTADMIDATKLTFTSTSGNSGTFVFSSYNNDDVEGEYTIDENNDITFDQGLSAVISETEFAFTSTMSLNTTSENKLRILKTKTDLLGLNVTEMWLGQRSTEKNEYMVYHFVLGSGAGGDVSEIEIAFDNSKLIYGDLEANGNFRVELYNDFGSTKDNPPLDPADVVVSGRLSITFTLSGITLKDGAAGSYKTALSLADGDWTPQYWGDGTGPGEATVTGDGTYTVWYEPESTSDGAVVFLIDILGLATDVADMNAVTATINSIKVQ